MGWTFPAKATHHGRVVFFVDRGRDTLYLPPSCSGRPKAHPCIGAPPFGVPPPELPRTYYATFLCLCRSMPEGHPGAPKLAHSLSLGSERPRARPVNAKTATNPSSNYAPHPHSYRLTPTPLPPGPRPYDWYHTHHPTPSQPKMLSSRRCRLVHWVGLGRRRPSPRPPTPPRGVQHQMGKIGGRG